MQTQADWEYQFTIKDKHTQNIAFSKIKYTKASSETKVKELISKDIPSCIKIKSKETRWKTLKQTKNLLYCRKENKDYSILAKIKLIQPTKGAKECLTPTMSECNAN